MADRRRMPLGLLLVVAALYAVTHYGGIRSSDAEVVFRVAQSLADRGSFALERDLEDWRGFGVAGGRDGRLYAIYPPVQSILAVPFVWAGEAASASGLGRALARHRALAWTIAGMAAARPLTDRTLYLDWKTSPLFHLLDGSKGPLLFRALPAGAVPLWTGGGVLIGGLFLIAFRRWETVE